MFALETRRANVAAGNPTRESKRGALDEKPGDDAGGDTDREPPMHLRARQDTDHIGHADMRRRRLIEAGGIAQHTLDEMVHHGNGDVGKKKAGDLPLSCSLPEISSA